MFSKAYIFRCFVLLTLSIPTMMVCAQDNAPFNKLEVRQLAPLSFNYADAGQLVSKQTIENALEVSIKIKQEDVQVMAQVQFNGSGNAHFHDLLGLQLIRKTSQNAQVPAGSIALSNVPVQLIMQPRSDRGTKHYLFYYAVFLNPSEKIIPPGNHGFSILFTLTPQ